MTLLSVPAFASASIDVDTKEMISLGEDVTASEFADFFNKFKGLALFVSGLCTITALIFFIISLTKLSTSAGNDAARSKAIHGILYSGISLALFGGISVVVGVAWNMIG